MTLSAEMQMAFPLHSLTYVPNIGKLHCYYYNVFLCEMSETKTSTQ